MRNLCKSIFLAVLFCLPTLSFADDFQPNKIIGGEVVNKKFSPYVTVKIKIDPSNEDSDWGLSTGTMISKKHVLVAAHILNNYEDLSRYKVTTNDGQSFAVKKISIPSSYDENKPCEGSNMAILTLDKPIKKTKPLPILKNSKKIISVQTVTYYGYGCPTTDDRKGCWGTLRKAVSEIDRYKRGDYALLDYYYLSAGHMFEDGSPAATIKTTSKRVIKNKFGKKVIKKTKQDAIIGLVSCYWEIEDRPLDPITTRDAVALLQQAKLLKFIKKATKNKAKFVK